MLAVKKVMLLLKLTYYKSISDKIHVKLHINSHRTMIIYTIIYNIIKHITINITDCKECLPRFFVCRSKIQSINNSSNYCTITRVKSSIKTISKFS